MQIGFNIFIIYIYIYIYIYIILYNNIYFIFNPEEKYQIIIVSHIFYIVKIYIKKKSSKKILYINFELYNSINPIILSLT